MIKTRLCDLKNLNRLLHEFALLTKNNEKVQKHDSPEEIFVLAEKERQTVREAKNIVLRELNKKRLAREEKLKELKSANLSVLKRFSKG